MDASKRKAIEIKEQLPQMFLNHLICAGSLTDGLSACSGDSGGPLMAKHHDTKQWFQIALVHGKIGACEDSDYPASFVRLDDPTVFSFISSINETYSTTSKAPISTSNSNSNEDTLVDSGTLFD